MGTKLLACAFAAPADVTCEYLTNPLGIDAQRPRLAWMLRSGLRAQFQAAYQILVASDRKLLKEGAADLWDSGKIASDQSTQVPYAGGAISSRQRCWWTVRVWDAQDRPSAWSAPARWEMALLDAAEWTAQWISAPAEPQTWKQAKWIWFGAANALDKENPSATRYFRRSFDLSARPKEAWLAITADDTYAVSVNGTMVEATELTGAGWGETWRVVRQFEVSRLLRPGKNVIAVEAWNEKGTAGVLFCLSVAGALVRSSAFRLSGKDKLKLELRTGSRPPGSATPATVILSDAATRAAAGAPFGWREVDFDDSAWRPAVELGTYGCAPWNDVTREVGRPPLLRKGFGIDKQVARARLYITALGSYRASINGQRIGNDCLTPDWTDYRKRVTYQTYDVTDLVRKGDNAIGVMLGDGWYGSPLGWELQRFAFGGPPLRLLAQLELEYADGSRDLITTDNSWKTSPGPIIWSELYAGENYDARLEQKGWDAPRFNDREWTPAGVTPPEGQPILSAQCQPTIQVTQLVRPKSIRQSTNGTWIFDMGQEIPGWARLKVRAKAGTKVRLRFSEMLNPDGTLYRQNLRRAECTDTYFCKGGGVETFEPHFTYRAYRYVELSGYPGKPAKDTLVGCVAHTAAAPAGQFECSDPRITRLWRNITWSQRANMYGLPTDCPQRDERLGWTGDANLFAAASCFNADMAAFFTKWMKDLVDSQSADGAFPDVAPRVVNPADGAPVWGDAGIVIPWTLYLMYGDTRIVETYFGAMAKWIDYIHSANPDGLWLNRRNNDFGDWIPAGGETPKEVIATAAWALDAKLMSRMAAAIGRPADAQQYEQLFQKIRSAFNTKFVDAEGRIHGDSQTCYILALHCDLLSPDLRKIAADRLVADIDKRGGHLSTGFVGTGYLMPVLTEAGHMDVAYRLLLQCDYPSWLFMVDRGATTMWERWDGWTEDKGFQETIMNSFNHFAFGVVAEWLYRYVGGIEPNWKTPGFRHIIIRPRPGALTSARTTYNSSRGQIATEWRVGPKGRQSLDVTIPQNTTATVYLPAGTITESGRALEKAQAIKRMGEEDGCVVLEVGGGSYSFAVRP